MRLTHADTSLYFPHLSTNLSRPSKSIQGLHSLCRHAPVHCAYRIIHTGRPSPSPLHALIFSRGSQRETYPALRFNYNQIPQTKQFGSAQPEHKFLRPSFIYVEACQWGRSPSSYQLEHLSTQGHRQQHLIIGH